MLESELLGFGSGTGPTMAFEKKERKEGAKPYRRRDSDRHGSRGSGDRRSDDRRSGDRPRRDRNDRPKRDQGDLPRRGQGDRSKRNYGDRPKRDYGSRPAHAIRDDSPSEEPQETRRLILPQDASRLLYKGIDYLEKGDTNVAMVMFLHGSVMMSEGCENNADRILKGVGKSGYQAMRTEIGPNCSEDALTEFDYLCMTHSKSYDRTFFDTEYSKGTTHAIYRKICLEEIEGDDPVIDQFALRYSDEAAKVKKGLEILIKKKDSESASKHLARFEEAAELKKSIYTLFTRSMNGDASAVRQLKEHSKKVPEAAFFSEFLAARSEGKAEEWLRAKYPQYKDLIISKQGEFKIQDTPFGTYLKAKSLERKKEEYMSVMMNAAKAGSPEALEELSNKMFRNDVRKCLAGIYLKNNDLPKLVLVYQAGLDDMYYLDQYCGDDADRILDAGKELGKQSVGKEIDWLKDHYDKGMDFCKDALIEKSKDGFYQNKKMIYALHDIGCDMEAAQLYFSMEGNPELPSVKWLKKVCANDEVKDFVRKHFEDIGDIATFDSIFADDGYERRPKRQSGGRKPFGKPRRRYRSL